MNTSKLTRRDIAAEVFVLGLRRAVSQRRDHPQAQSIPDVFGDLFTAWLSNPSANARSLKEEAGYLVWHTRRILDGVRYSSAVRRSMSIATSSGNTSSAVGYASIPVDDVLDLLSDGLGYLAEEQVLADAEAARRRAASAERWERIKSEADALVEQAEKKAMRVRRRNPSAVAAFNALQRAESQAEVARILGCDYMLARRLAACRRTEMVTPAP